MKTQKYNEPIQARTENQQQLNKLFQIRHQADPKQIQALFAEDLRLTGLINQEISKLKK